MKFILKNKKYLFLNNISNMYNLVWYFFYLIIFSCVSVSIILWLNKKIILVNKFIKNN